MMKNARKISQADVRRVFAEGLTETISTMTGFGIFEQKGVIEPGLSVEICGAMVLKGERNALLIIGTGKASAAVLVTYMTGIELDGLDQKDLIDGVAEIVNMTAGLAKVKLAETDYFFSLSPPIAITGENIGLITKSFSEKYEYNFMANEILLKLGIYYF